MSFANVKLILAREIRDQLRDRRTLFMIFVLPLLLYPLLAMSFLQVSQFLQEQPTSVLVFGARGLAELPPLVENNRFAEYLFREPEGSRLLVLTFVSDEPGARQPSASRSAEEFLAEARRAVRQGQFDAAVCFPEDFARRTDLFRQASRQRALEPSATASSEAVPHGLQPGSGTPVTVPVHSELQVPSPVSVYSTAKERSLIAFARLSEVLRRWNEALGEENLAALGMPAEAARPFCVQMIDVADETGFQRAATWAKILPMLLVLWAMTGAFYPAVDLCAGEKERGTLETLLSSPAGRGEIVCGKLLTIMLFSMATAVLNLVSMAITGLAVMTRLPLIGPPPALSAVWLALALLPLSALFSALCLALAAFARSTKEGQYYLVPLMLVSMPLVILPMSPAVELNLGNSLIPVTGLVLLLRSAIEGSYWQALQYFPPVAAVTLACCLLALRWAVEQFNSESVLFRESERLDVGLWLRHLVCDRQPTPTVAAAVCCGVLILALRFFLGLALPEPADFRGFAVLTLISQVAVILAPALLMTVVLTRSPAQTLLLRPPRWLAVAAAAGLAVVLHPLTMALQAGVRQLYPASEKLVGTLSHWQQFIDAAPLWSKLLVLAAVPAVCEELAFRGFVLSGLRHLGHKWRAIVYAAVLFGLSHAVLQQSLTAILLGVLLGYLAVQSGSIWPGIVFHLTHNGLLLALSRWPAQALDRWPELTWLISPASEDGCVYRWPAVAGGALLGAWLICYFARLPCPKSAEEQLQELIAASAVPEDTAGAGS